ncbi:MAG: hypothetical protein C0391_02210 [Anaerolinea sp.]|nr:hypothetical protein [Anaerolinea sp.]
MMNAIANSPGDTLELASGQILAILAPHAGRSLMLETAARFALRGPVRVLDGSNHFNAYIVARSIRRFTADIDSALARISLARAFTCYQMEALLAAAALLVQHQPAPAPATLIFDLLATFYDENVHLVERQRLLLLCQRYFRAISAHSPLLISLRPASADRPDQQTLLDEMLAFADDIWQAEAPAAPAIPRLF